MSRKRTALQAVCETELDDPFQGVKQALKKCQQAITTRSWDVYSSQEDVDWKKHEIEEDEAGLHLYEMNIQRVEFEIERKRRELRLLEHKARISRDELEGFEKEEKSLRVAQDRGEEFLKTLLKAGKDELEELIKEALTEAESSSKERMKMESRENEGDV
ncbi:uncharacterized protein EAF02_005063 [Botrytis sinoallii]|uniref:uncharacterized protein n=1 Tax=Botrytis sinoallii TaxID=1463999 RepID=UPI0019001E03|nr:uncharacterized protein EAF02_005063 [Botrytis sinoallii]KAF7884727.1 hypothetical protein EAF02_005063 [Botrytis sinoallii]